MQLSRLLRGRLALLTSLMLLAAAMMPTLSIAFGKSNSQNWAEICTPHGIKKVFVASVDGPIDSGRPTLGTALEHCPFCSLGSHSPALPASPLKLVAQVDARHEPVAPPCQAARTSKTRCSAQPRAPPVST